MDRKYLALAAAALVAVVLWLAWLWQPERLSPAGWRAPLEMLWWLEHKLLRLVNVAFLLLVAAVLIWRHARRQLRWDLDATAISALILASSALQAVADRGAGSRYGMTTQALVVLVVLRALSR